MDCEISAAYCGICKKYFVLKRDYNIAKTLGVLLCKVEDKTQLHLNKFKSIKNYNGESIIHKLGYNVKKNNGYTDVQRHIILANIIENNKISKYEIKSNIIANIARHQCQPNYYESVNCWKQDLEFVDKYQLGDIPEVKIDNIIIGKRIAKSE